MVFGICLTRKCKFVFVNCDGIILKIGQCRANTDGLQTIAIATADGNDVVVASGLQPGMEVVAAGVHVLSPGHKVTIYREKAAASAPPAQAAASAAK